MSSKGRKLKIRKCCFRNCQNNSQNDDNLKFYRFNDTNVKSWLEACRNDHLKTLKKRTLICDYQVCEAHFQKEDFTILINPYELRLNRSAVPRDLLSMYIIDVFFDKIMGLLGHHEVKNYCRYQGVGVHCVLQGGK